MFMKRVLIGLVLTMTGLLLATPSYADKPEIFRFMTDFNFLVVECDGFEVWTKGWQKETEKLWFNEDDEPVRLQWTLHITESEYYNYLEPEKTVSQGKNGAGEGLSYTFDFTTGDEHWSGDLFRITIPGVGHVLLDAGTWFWDASEEIFVHHGPDYALVEGESGLALCEALE
jgi:hypothetical protein